MTPWTVRKMIRLRFAGSCCRAIEISREGDQQLASDFQGTRHYEVENADFRTYNGDGLEILADLFGVLERLIRNRMSHGSGEQNGNGRVSGGLLGARPAEVVFDEASHWADGDRAYARSDNEIERDAVVRWIGCLQHTKACIEPVLGYLRAFDHR